jgi:hypothetical protein
MSRFVRISFDRGVSMPEQHMGAPDGSLDGRVRDGTVHIRVPEIPVHQRN